MKKTNINESPHGWPKTDGRTVPEGYFDDFARRMMEKLPESVPVIAAPKRTVWQKIRPYVYMAAMFAGVYLMMNIFTLTTGIRNMVNPTDTSMMLAELVNTDMTSYVDEYMETTSPYFYDDLYESGFEIPDDII